MAKRVRAVASLCVLLYAIIAGLLAFEASSVERHPLPCDSVKEWQEAYISAMRRARNAPSSARFAVLSTAAAPSLFAIARSIRGLLKNNTPISIYGDGRESIKIASVLPSEEEIDAAVAHWMVSAVKDRLPLNALVVHVTQTAAPAPSDNCTSLLRDNCECWGHTLYVTSGGVLVLVLTSPVSSVNEPQQLRDTLLSSIATESSWRRTAEQIFSTVHPIDPHFSVPPAELSSQLAFGSPRSFSSQFGGDVLSFGIGSPAKVATTAERLTRLVKALVEPANNSALVYFSSANYSDLWRQRWSDRQQSSWLGSASKIHVDVALLGDARADAPHSALLDGLLPREFTAAISDVLLLSVSERRSPGVRTIRLLRSDDVAAARRATGDDAADGDGSTLVEFDVFMQRERAASSDFTSADNAASTSAAVPVHDDSDNQSTTAFVFALRPWAAHMLVDAIDDDLGAHNVCPAEPTLLLVDGLCEPVYSATPTPSPPRSALVEWYDEMYQWWYGSVDEAIEVEGESLMDALRRPSCSQYGGKRLTLPLTAQGMHDTHGYTCTCALAADADAGYFTPHHDRTTTHTPGRSDIHRAGRTITYAVAAMRDRWHSVRRAYDASGNAFVAIAGGVEDVAVGLCEATGLCDAAWQYSSVSDASPACGPYASALCTCVNSSSSSNSSNSNSSASSSPTAHDGGEGDSLPPRPSDQQQQHQDALGIRACAVSPPVDTTGGDGCAVLHVVGVLPPPTESPLYVLSTQRQQQQQHTTSSTGEWRAKRRGPMSPTHAAAAATAAAAAYRGNCDNADCANVLRYEHRLPSSLMVVADAYSPSSTSSSVLTTSFRVQEWGRVVLLRDGTASVSTVAAVPPCDGRSEPGYEHDEGGAGNAHCPSPDACSAMHCSADASSSAARTDLPAPLARDALRAAVLRELRASVGLGDDSSDGTDVIPLYPRSGPSDSMPRHCDNGQQHSTGSIGGDTGSVGGDSITLAELRLLHARWWGIHLESTLRHLGSMCVIALDAQPRLRVPRYAASAMHASLSALASAVRLLLPSFPSHYDCPLRGGDDDSCYSQQQRTVCAEVAAGHRWRLYPRRTDVTASLVELRRARGLAEELSRDPSLVADPHIPPVHLAAIYLPAWAPLLTPLLLAVVAGISALCCARRQGKGAIDGVNSGAAAAGGDDLLGLAAGTAAGGVGGAEVPLIPAAQVAGGTVLAPAPVAAAPTGLAQYSDMTRAATSALHDTRTHLSSFTLPSGVSLSLRSFTPVDATAVRELWAEGQRAHITDAASRAIYEAYIEDVLRGEFADLAGRYCAPLSGGSSNTKRMWVVEMDRGDVDALVAAAAASDAASPLSGELAVPSSASASPLSGDLAAISSDSASGPRVIVGCVACEPTETVAAATPSHNDDDDDRMPEKSSWLPTTDSSSSSGSTGNSGSSSTSRSSSSGDDAQPRRRRRVVELKRMCVSSSVRRCGVASALIRHVLEWSRDAGYDVVRLSTLATMTSACALYERNGFCYVGPKTGVMHLYAGHPMYVVMLERAI